MKVVNWWTRIIGVAGFVVAVIGIYTIIEEGFQPNDWWTVVMIAIATLTGITGFSKSPFFRSWAIGALLFSTAFALFLLLFGKSTSQQVWTVVLAVVVGGMISLAVLVFADILIFPKKEK